MTKGLPVVFLYRGFSSTLPYVIAQLRHFSPSARVLLLGDRGSDYLRGLAELHDIDAYSQGTDVFASVYEHLNTNPREFELVCFERWFIVVELMKRLALEQVLVADADVLFYCDVAQERDRFGFERFDLTSSGGFCPHLCFVNSRAALERLCAFMVTLYRTRIDELRALYAEYRTRHAEGGITDMTAFGKYAREHPGLVGDTMAVVDDRTFDHTVLEPWGYAMDGPIKKLTWVDGAPHFTRVADGRLVRANALHLSSWSKRYLGEFYRGPRLPPRVALVRHYRTATQRVLSLSRRALARMGRLMGTSSRAR